MTANPRPIIKPFTRQSLKWMALLIVVSFALTMALWQLLPWLVVNYLAPGSIHIVQASYGGSCGANDVTEVVADRCEGRMSCNFTLEPASLRQPANICATDFAATWTCGKARARKLTVVANGGPQAPASIACPSSSEASK